MKTATEKSKRRCKEALELREKGHTYREIGQIIGTDGKPERPITTTQAKHLVGRGVSNRRSEDKNGSLYDKMQNEVGARTVNCLLAHGVTFGSLQEIIDKLKIGEIAPKQVPNLGKKSYSNLVKWLGLELPPTMGVTEEEKKAIYKRLSEQRP